MYLSGILQTEEEKMLMEQRAHEAEHIATKLIDDYEIRFVGAGLYIVGSQ